MSAHITDDLPRLLSGEATRDEVLAAATHLRGCDDCREELVSAVVAHASLTSAQRFAPEIMTSAGLTGERPAPLPDLSAMFETVRAEKQQQDAGATPDPSSTRRRTLAAVGAIAAGVAIGSGVTVLVNDDTSSPAGRSVALAAFDDGPRTVSGTARMSAGNRMTIDAGALPRLDGRHRYEVWLTNSGRTAMQPVGWLDENGKASLTVPAPLVSSYTSIEVSVQQVDAPTYTYSGKSVLRGAYS